jgi:cytochrome c oxidase assembly protein subunit 15
MALPRVSPPAYRRATLGALVLLTIIVVTGASVRLTGSGLGCSDWPNCEQGKLVAPFEYHAWIEFGNRLVTGVVGLVVIAVVLGSLRREPRRRDLIWLSWFLVAGVLVQAIIGRFTVEYELHPAIVALHFVLSFVLITAAVVLHHRASAEVITPPARTGLTTSLLAVALLVIIAGTVVTGTGPHGGDETAHRFQLVMTDVVRVHSVLVWILVTLTVFLAIRTRHRAVLVLLAIEVVQGAVGYTQYFAGVPPLLVAVHVIGALAVWIAALRVRLSVG